MNMPAATSTSLYLSEKAKVLFPDVDEIIDVGHATHGADDPNLAGTHSQRIAQRIVDDFLAIRTTPGTVEDAYMAAARRIARGYGRALRRERDIWSRKMLAAEKRKARHEERIQKNWESEGLGALTRFLWPALLGLVGLILALVLGSTVPESISDKTGTSAPTAALIIGSIILGRIFSKWWRERTRDRIDESYEVRRRLADDAYETAQLREQQYWRARAVEAWKQYTGEDFPDRASYSIVMEGNMVERRKHKQILFQHEKTDIERLQEIVRWLIDACLKPVRRNKTKTPVE